ncbi:aldehyde dehydrogenase family protein [Dermatobacter hominis]|uniref:aldehyde dehydrogenase family protein n=1 Tax=Dermatobacter hominis TaxID=2884263 RepID=UPI001D120B5D|nr:aldehyde dehydrogenase family protein [Dermatobacter hominis]UDY36360.1 aldehyde dehydrogenase family protein [Dermatobacter hominis]
MTDITPALIDGTDVLADEVNEVRSPYDGSVVGVVPACTTADLDRAIAVALERHRAGPPPAFERAEVLDRAAVLLTERLDEFARSISEESAKPITTARVEAQRAVDTIRFSAAEARTFTGEMVPLDASSAGVGKLGFTKRVPIGVVGAISPFNFPLNLVCHKIAPAVAAGCPVVLKPASSTPLTALRIARLFEEAGLPPGWLNVVTCSGRVANHMVLHPDVAMITFTGSPEVGWGIRADAPRKRVSLELGNNAPVVIEPDGDWETAAAKIAVGGYAFAGQTCISVQRVYVHNSLHEGFVAALAEKVGQLKVGPPSDPATEVSALIDPGETDRVAAWIAEATDEGARLVVGGTRGDHDVLVPTLLDGVRPDMKVCTTEVFGPLVGVAPYERFDDALALANDTRYGLQASVFTTDIGKALKAADTLDFGGVLVNELPSWRADQQPYGGVRDSGNTREGPPYTVQEMTERRMIVIQG